MKITKRCRKRCRRAVAPAISTVILVGATIAIAIAAYQYVASSLAISQARANFEDAKEAFKEMARWLNTFAFTKGASQSIPISLAYGSLKKVDSTLYVRINGVSLSKGTHELRFYTSVRDNQEVLYGPSNFKITHFIKPNETSPIPVVYVDKDADGKWFVALNTSRALLIDQGTISIDATTYRKYSMLLIIVENVTFTGSGNTFNLKILVRDVEYSGTFLNVSKVTINGEDYINFEPSNILVIVISYVDIIASGM